MTEKIIIAGSGGQGIMLLGKLLAEAAMQENLFVTWLPSYGAEVRGGTSHCMVVISTQEIGSPTIDQADTLIIMNRPSLEKFKHRLVRRGLLIINSSLAPSYDSPQARVLLHPFTDKAISIGNIRVANVVALGCYLAEKKIISLKTVRRLMREKSKKVGQDLVQMNQRALEEGVKLSW